LKWTGDEFYLMEDNKLVCKTDYESAKQRGKNQLVSVIVNKQYAKYIEQAFSSY